MADESTPKYPDGGQDDTTDYSGLNAPETGAEMVGRDSSGDPRLIPGGRMGSHYDVGMSGMNRDDVPSGAAKPEQLNTRDSPKSA